MIILSDQPMSLSILFNSCTTSGVSLLFPLGVYILLRYPVLLPSTIMFTFFICYSKVEMHVKRMSISTDTKLNKAYRLPAQMDIAWNSYKHTNALFYGLWSSPTYYSFQSILQLPMELAATPKLMNKNQCWTGTLGIWYIKYKVCCYHIKHSISQSIRL